MRTQCQVTMPGHHACPHHTQICVLDQVQSHESVSMYFLFDTVCASNGKISQQEVWDDPSAGSVCPELHASTPSGLVNLLSDWLNETGDE